MYIEVTFSCSWFPFPFRTYRSIQTPANANTKYSIHILDTPGFQDPESIGVATGTTFDNLCHNYAQERLQMLFHDSTFTAEQDRYIQVCDTTTCSLVVSMILLLGCLQCFSVPCYFCSHFSYEVDAILSYYFNICIW